MKKSLNLKIVTNMFLIGMIVALVACIISYSVYKNTVISQSEKTLSNAALSISHTLESESIEILKDKVIEIYHAYVNEAENDVIELEGDELDNYLALYDEVIESQEYIDLMLQLERLTKDNEYKTVCIIFNDVETEKSVYLIDGELTFEDKCMPGVCDEWGEVERNRILEKKDYSFPVNTTNTREYGWLCSVGQEIQNSSGEMIGTVCVDISMDGLMKKISNFMKNLVIILVVIVVVIIVVNIFIFRKSIVKPIKELSMATASFVSDTKAEIADESAITKLNINTGDEIEELSNSVKNMEKDLINYIKELTVVTAEKEKVGAELNVAKQIQKSMLPCIFPRFSDIKYFDIYATMDPAKEVGGDFYDFFMVDETHVAIVMADVSGKGVPAALFMVIGKTLIKDHTNPESDLGAVFSKVNNLLCESNSEGLFITAFEGVLDLVTGEFNYVNAGHEMPFICKKGDVYKPYQIKPAFVLAGMEDMRYKAGTMVLEPGDKLFQYTDGVTEATNSKNELYGMNRLEEILNKNINKKPIDLLPAIKLDIDKFVGLAPQFDDITMLGFEFKEKMVLGE